MTAGKGAIVCSNTEEALSAIQPHYGSGRIWKECRPAGGSRKAFGRAGVSVLALVAGRTIIPLQATQDHKQALDGDKGPNTGGMGAYCPAPLATPELWQEIESQILVPTVHALKRHRRPFRGLLYAGVMVTNQGPRVLEFNARFGDPETQPLLMRLKTDLLELFNAVVDDRLGDFAEDKLVWDLRPAVCVVMASGGYPGNFKKGYPITGLEAAAELPDVKVFHAGTKDDKGRIVTDGGRVLSVTALEILWPRPRTTPTPPSTGSISRGRFIARISRTRRFRELITDAAPIDWPFSAGIVSVQGVAALLRPEGQTMTKILHGIVRGKIIELDQEAGVPEGQEVEIAIEPSFPRSKRNHGAKGSADVPAPWLTSQVLMRTWRRSWVSKIAKFREVPE